MEGHHFILWEQDLSAAIHGDYNALIVVLSYLVASIAGICAFAIIGYVKHNQSQRRLLTTLGGVILGMGIWSMHYTGMLAFSLPIKVMHNPLTTFISILPAIAASFIFLTNLTKDKISLSNILLTAFVLAFGITTMHFIGMSAMSMQAQMSHDPILLFIAILISWSLAVFTLLIKSKKIEINYVYKYQHLTLCGALFGFTVASMHYLAMSSTYFFIDDSIFISGIDNNILSKSLILFSLILMLTLILTLYFNQRIVKLISLKDTHKQHVIDTIDNMQDGFVLSDDDGNALLINSKFKQMFFNDQHLFSVGSSVENMYQQLIIDNFKFDTTAQENDFLDIIRNKSNSLVPIIIHDKDNKSWLLRQNKASDNTFIQTWTDISLQIKKDKELVEANKMAALGNLVAGVAHEMNTPLGVSITSVSRISEILDDVDESLSSGLMSKNNLNKSLKMIANLGDLTQKNLKHMAHLVQQFKYISVDQNIERVKKFTLSSVITELETTWDGAFDNNNITLNHNFNADFTIIGYKESLIQVLYSFYSNAFNHAFNADKIGQIDISAQISSQMLRITFTDNGCGIPADIITKVFEPFVTTKRQEGGVGLGLHIAHNLVVHKMKGAIQVVDIMPQPGSQFLIELPLIISQNN